MSEEENIDAYLSSREREHREDQSQVEPESSVAGGVYKAVVEGEETSEPGEPSASTVEQPQPVSRPQGKRASIKKIQKSITDLSKQLEKQTAQINKLASIAQTLQKQTKSAQKQSELTNQIRSQVSQIQRQLSQVHKTVQKKTPAAPARKPAHKPVKKKTTKKKK